MSIAHFIAKLIWIGIAFASVGRLVEVTQALQKKAIHAHQFDQISRSKFTRLMTEGK